MLTTLAAVVRTVRRLVLRFQLWNTGRKIDALPVGSIYDGHRYRPMTMREARYWDLHVLPFGWVIVADHRTWRASQNTTGEAALPARKDA
jgi:hypothetical protein